MAAQPVLKEQVEKLQRENESLQSEGEKLQLENENLQSVLVETAESVTEWQTKYAGAVAEKEDQVKSAGVMIMQLQQRLMTSPSR